MKPHQEAISIIIDDGGGKFLAVKRPDNPDDDISGVWGLPAGILYENESHHDGAIRAGRQKLGVEIAVGEKMGESTHDRRTYTLHLTNYKAKVVSGTPKVPQGDKSVTQYAACKWSDNPKILIPAAQKGSQCTQLFLESRGIDWKMPKS